MKLSIQFLLPQRLLSWITRKLTRIEMPWFKNALIAGFSRLYHVNWQEAQLKTPAQFKHFNDFFTRALQEDARPLADSAFIMPADGKIVCANALEKMQFVHAKGHDFNLSSLIADDHLAQAFQHGLCTTIYLSPRDYHRIHMPATGTLKKMIHIPGKLYSVSLKTAELIPTLFAENERVVCVFDSEFGEFIMVLVGAINVSSIETTWAGTITPPYGKIITYKNYDEVAPIILEKGSEMGRFNMGSTVILLTKSQGLTLESALKENVSVQMGEPLIRTN